MNEFRRFILESHFGTDFARAVFESLPMFEAVNINKELFIKEAGSPEAVKLVKDRVNQAWKDARMDGIVRGGNLQQKLMNFLYLMEIRQPGFVDADVLRGVHDLAIGGSLEQRFLSRVNSDTTPEQAHEILDVATEGAKQAAKPYPDLSPAEERIWNRVQVYHEFPDGFKWVYAVDENGKIAPSIPANITDKTMHHCGNSPRANSDDQYFELRGPDGKAYLTVILDNNGRVEESKSWGNQTNKYRLKILPYVKWFLKDQKVTGVGHRYDFGYATDKNFGVKDFIGDDQEFIDYVIENKDELIGATESRILFWQDAVKDGLITVDDLKKAYMDGMTLSKLFKSIPGLEDFSTSAKFQIKETRADPHDSIFGANSFSVLCAVCNGNPFTVEELTELIDHDRLSLEVFANYNVHLLTPEVQYAFVRHNQKNLDTLIEISNQVASFKVAPDLWRALVPTDSEMANKTPDLDRALMNRCDRLIRMVVNSNPPEKMRDVADELLHHRNFLDYTYGIMSMRGHMFENRFGYVNQTPTSIYLNFATILGNYEDIPLPDGFADVHLACVQVNLGDMKSDHDARNDILNLLTGDKKIGTDRNGEILGHYSDRILEACILAENDNERYGDIKKVMSLMCELFGADRIKRLVAKVGEKSTGVSGAMCSLFPDDTLTGEFAENAVRGYVYGTTARGSHAWETRTYTWERAASHADVVMDILLNKHEILEGLDWASSDTFLALSRLIRSFSEFDIKAEKEKVSRFVLFYIGKLMESGDSGFKVCHSGDGYHSDELLRKLAGIVSSYHIDSPLVSEFYRTQCEISLDERPEDDVVGAWSMFTIPFEEWNEEMETHGFAFINHYVMLAPIDVLLDNAFMIDFVCDKLVDCGNRQDIAEFIGIVNRVSNRAKKAAIGKVISRRIVADQYPITDSLFNTLYDNRMIKADAYRAVLGRREDRGAMSVEDTPTAANVLKAFNSIQKLDTLPDLISATFKYLVDYIYDHMGDGRFRWNVDETCGTEVELLSALASKLAMKATVGKVPLAIKRLYDDGIVTRLQQFEQANRQACEVPGKPKSKITCSAVSDIKDAVWNLERVMDNAFAAAEKAMTTPKRKATARKKAATP